ncbi:MAG: peptidylprolyl isomerase [Pseudanabaenaceae cyanobacterium]
MRSLFLAFLAAIILVLGGCSIVDRSSLANSDRPTAPVPPTPTQTMADYANLPRLNGTAKVALKLATGTITLDIDGQHAPITAGNFVDLVQRGFYNGLTFHRVEKQPQPFVVQGGDPLGNGTGGFVDPQTSQERRIPLEIAPAGKPPVYGVILPAGTQPQLSHERGAVAMARSSDPNSASSQFYITLSNTDFLDGSYAVFGYVRNPQDMALVDQIKVGDRIESATVVAGAENLQKGQ